MKKLLLLLSIFLISFNTQTQLQSLIDMEQYGNAFDYEIRYATNHNFISETLYDCPKCYLHPDVALAILEANEYFCELGYKIKFYDCYRPLAVQKKMWKKVPRPTYVANPYTKGSVHNRGAAVDLTLVTLDGCFVDMGSDYDFFGRASHIDNYSLPKTVLENRKLLQDGLKKVGFKTVRTEWWHFGYQKNWSYPILDTPFNCD